MEATSKGIRGKEPQQSALNMIFSITHHSELHSDLSFLMFSNVQTIDLTFVDKI